jgi:hypothetical protein
VRHEIALESDSEDKPTTSLSTKGFAGQRQGWHVDILLILGSLAFVMLVSQNFTYLYTPDSEFYLTLAAFGDNITDRAADPLYFWTKLGIIAPQYVLSHYLGFEMAHLIFRASVLMLVMSSAYVTVRTLDAPRAFAASGALLLGLNTVVLGFAGDTYVTSAGMAALSVIIALFRLLRQATQRQRFLIATCVGGVIGWSVMSHPYSAILGGALTCSLAILFYLTGGFHSWKSPLQDVIAVILGAWLIFATLIFVGTLIFPRLNWIETVYSFGSTADGSIWASADWTWVRQELSFLVIFSCLVIVISLWLLPGGGRRNLEPVVAISSVVTTAVAYALLNGGPNLEASFFNGLLWPPALLALIGCYALRCSEPTARWPAWLLTAGTAVLLTITGHSQVALTPLWAWTIFAVIVLSSALLAGLSTRLGDTYIAVTVALVVAGCGFQLLQNGRTLEPAGKNQRQPYYNAFVENKTTAQVRRNIEVQSWVLENTSDGDTVMVWAPQVSTAVSEASMQLFGPNSLTVAPTAEFDAGIRFTQYKPNKIVLYGQSAEDVANLTSQLSTIAEVTDQSCQAFTTNQKHVGTLHQLPDVTACVTSVSPITETAPKLSNRSTKGS